MCLAKTLRVFRSNDLECTCWRALRYDALMFVRFLHLFGWVISVFCSREELLLENLALRQQLLALHAKRPRPRLSSVDKLFWFVFEPRSSAGNDGPLRSANREPGLGLGGRFAR